MVYNIFLPRLLIFKADIQLLFEHFFIEAVLGFVHFASFPSAHESSSDSCICDSVAAAASKAVLVNLNMVRVRVLQESAGCRLYHRYFHASDVGSAAHGETGLYMQQAHAFHVQCLHN